MRLPNPLLAAAGAAALLLLPSLALANNVPINDRSAAEVIAKLNLLPNAEKGYYNQTFGDAALVNGGRPASTLIYYLLEGDVGESRWHRVYDAEVWHYYAGAPLTLSLSFNDSAPVEKKVLGPDIFAGQEPQAVVLENQWQRARSHGSWTLVGTTVAPGFDFHRYEIAPDGWEPTGSCAKSAAAKRARRRNN